MSLQMNVRVPELHCTGGRKSEQLNGLYSVLVVLIETVRMDLVAEGHWVQEQSSERGGASGGLLDNIPKGTSRQKPSD